MSHDSENSPEENQRTASQRWRLPGGCPRWCSVDHNGDDPRYRPLHRSDELELPLLRYPPGSSITEIIRQGVACDYLTIQLIQPATDPLIRMWIGAGSSTQGFVLTLGETEHLTALLAHIRTVATS